MLRRYRRARGGICALGDRRQQSYLRRDAFSSYSAGCGRGTATAPLLLRSHSSDARRFSPLLACPYGEHSIEPVPNARASRLVGAIAVLDSRMPEAVDDRDKRLFRLALARPVDRLAAARRAAGQVEVEDDRLTVLLWWQPRSARRPPGASR